MGVQNFCSVKMGVFSPTFCIFGGQKFLHICIFSQKHFSTIFRQFADSRKIHKKETYSNITFLSCSLATTPLTVVYRQTKTLTTDCSWTKDMTDSSASSVVFPFRYKKATVSCNFPICIVDWDFNFYRYAKREAVSKVTALRSGRRG